ncbi:M20 aminoacylase family protein [Corticimicrobacter populi]|uniref:Amidohydrolase n=1 Tax=Corticimicrobacter populi TaxID=2175229 RepID=A0A2V1K0B3_9BURK|nr:M20 aminoacylase family protein [Corticimicrobacter populi]PWF22478.1 amidohydrolase [Corticimicrobacter populi]QDQ86386.1 amidohydrolase [Alcaligenaceae bacterium SJ-26]
MQLLEPIVGWQAEMAALRRDIHAHPELGYEEHRTSGLIADRLTAWGIPVIRGLAGTGVVGVIKGNQPDNGRAIGLRADMDALPMQEVNTFAHASTIPGKMHGCGHDGHTVTLLSAARYLAQHPDFAGTVYAIFQPAEEGGAGAERMVQDGLFERCPMDAVFGMHNWPGMPVGSFGLSSGPIMASSNEFDIVIEGKGAHAGMPHLGIDPVMAAVQIAQALQSIVTRNRNPLDAAVLSVTQIHTGSAYNVVPNEAILRGTVRTFTDVTLDLIERRMGEIVEHTGLALGCKARLRFERNYPPTVNDAIETAVCADVLTALAGPEQVITQVEPSMGAEDFAFMLRHKPGSYVWLGNGDGTHREAGAGAGPCMLHNGSYDFNDDLIPLGATYWVRLAQHRLAQPPAR